MPGSKWLKLFPTLQVQLWNHILYQCWSNRTFCHDGDVLYQSNTVATSQIVARATEELNLYILFINLTLLHLINLMSKFK